jgi:hypothetical protein
VFCPDESPTLGVVIWFSNSDFCSNDRVGESILKLELENEENSKQQQNVQATTSGPEQVLNTTADTVCR